MFLQFIIPYYGSANLLFTAVKSILRQYDREGIGIIIVDDNHLDEYGTTESRKVRDFIDKHSLLSHVPILYLKNEENIGVGCTRNRGLAAASAKWVTFVDSDDEVRENFVSVFKAGIAKDPSAKVFVGKYLADHPNGAAIYNDMTWLHAKVYLLSFLRFNNITFPPLRFNEDGGFNLMVYEMTKAFYFTNDHIVIYDWKHNPESLTRTKYTPMYSTLHYIKTITFGFRQILKKYSLNQTLRIPSTIAQLYWFYNEILYQDSNAHELDSEIQSFFDVIHHTKWYESEREKGKLATSVSTSHYITPVIPQITLAQFVKKFEKEPLNFK